MAEYDDVIEAIDEALDHQHMDEESKAELRSGRETIIRVGKKLGLG